MGKQFTQTTIIIILILSLMITNSIKTVESQSDVSADEQVFVYRIWETLNTSATPLSWNYPSGIFSTLWYWQILNTVGASLYQKYEPTSGPYHDYIPQLAETLPTITDDGLTFTITLKEGLKFSNGNPLDADDVVFSYNLYLTPLISLQRY